MSSTTIQVPDFLMKANKHWDALADATCRFILDSPETTSTSFFGRIFKPGLDSLENNRPQVKTAVKIALLVVAVLGVWAIICHPYLMFASILTGVVVSLEEKTKQSILKWLKEAKGRVIQPILDNETPLERVAIAILAATVVTIAATTIVVPSTVGIVTGMQLRQYLTQKPR